MSAAAFNVLVYPLSSPSPLLSAPTSSEKPRTVAPMSAHAPDVYGLLRFHKGRTGFGLADTRQNSSG